MSSIIKSQSSSVRAVCSNHVHFLFCFVLFLKGLPFLCCKSPQILIPFRATSTPRRQSRLLRSCRCRPLQRPVGWERRRAPVRLIEVYVKRPCPVGKHPLLSDEAVVTAPPTALVGNVHGTLVRATRLVVVIGDRLVLRLPAVMEKR